MFRSLLAILVGVLITTPALASGDACKALPGESLGDLSILWVIPFAGLLLSIAIVPMVAGHWWHHNKNQLLTAVLWALPVLGYLVYLMVTNGDRLGCEAGQGLQHAIMEYVSFIALLGSLFIISGGILLKGDLQGKPGVNTTFLAVGTVLANVIGTTGASMLLIQPVLRTNSERKHVWHIPLFFIFLVSNIGGSLTPIGDPPLFLGYLRGVPFWWTLTHLWWLWLPTVIILLVMFYVLDSVMYRRETKRDRRGDAATIDPLGLEGSVNFLLLAGVIAAVLLLSPVNHGAAEHDDAHADDHGALVTPPTFDGTTLLGTAAHAEPAPVPADALAADPPPLPHSPDATRAPAKSADAHAADEHATDAHPGDSHEADDSHAAGDNHPADDSHAAADSHAAGDNHAADDSHEADDSHAAGDSHEADDSHAASTHAEAKAWSTDPRDYFLREIVMALLAGLSLWLTSRRIHERNKFTFGPILEVAALFVGIFVAMVPATAMLQTHGGSLGLTEPLQYFWATGALSAFLDNAPTYVTFASVACGVDPTCISATDISPLSTGPSTMILVAISLGAVFMGAGSYIGNGPNFMVRAIAENYTMEVHATDADGNDTTEVVKPYRMPSFFGYVGWAALFLGPVFIVVTFIGLYLMA